MKFAKELERDLVPEWGLKYLDYKQGKKKLKLINRALRNVNQTPRLRRRGTNAFTPSPYDTAPKYSFLNRNLQRDTGASREPDDLRAIAIHNSQTGLASRPNGSQASLSLKKTNPEETPLNAEEDPRFPGLTRYGSILGSPPKEGSSSAKGKAPPSLKLPGAALDPENVSPNVGPSAAAHKKSKSVTLPAEAPATETDDAFKVGKTRSPTQTSSLPARYRSIFSPKRMNSSPTTPGGPRSTRPLLKRVFSLSHGAPPPSPGDVPLEAYRELDLRQADFFNFLDMELDKIETFYKQKEDEATERLAVLREQLHVMRDRRLDDLINRQAAKMKAKHAKNGDASQPLMNGHYVSSDDEGPEKKLKGKSLNPSWLRPIDSALEAVQAGKYGGTTKAMHTLGTPGTAPQHSDDRRDYVRRPEYPDVPYQTARRKLKVALQEYYRGLELLKSYALLNRTAFRKINKKYDKTVNARPSLRYMTEKVNKAWFVNSDVIEGHIRATEDLYARYFEKGQHKVAVGKLRIKIARAGDYTENSFRNGLLLGLGAVFGVQGAIKGCQLLSSDDTTLVTNTSYLLQIYAGYLLVNTLFMLFCLDCRFWHESKINYVFVFEYDTRHYLDWRQLSELPCFFLFLLGFFVWLNFSQYGAESMFLFYPVILISLTTIVLFNPIPILYARSRKWLMYSLWRLFCAGLYPVEWRDFYMGDMFCSLTYSMGNIELFFCLYANDWTNPGQCNSSSSRLLGFFSTLPGIWRAVQCFRRYHDTGNAFPHLLNLGKYAATIIFYMTLSIYRIDKNTTNRALFITFATINSIYTSFWDVYYDWSLGDPTAKYPFLRKTLGYKKVWMYYVAIAIDPLLRFNWIFYAILPVQLQHSAVTSFFVAFSEVCRRGMWSLFRVENEHCSNVGHFRASRDVPLPYDIPSSPKIADHERRDGPIDEEQPASPSLRRTSTAPVPNLEFQASGADPNLSRTRSSTRRRRRATSFAGQPTEESSPLARGLTRMGTILREAHAQDFEKKRKPELGSTAAKEQEDASSDEDDEEPSSGGRSGIASPDDAAEDEAELQTVRDQVGIGRSGPASGVEDGPSAA